MKAAYLAVAATTALIASTTAAKAEELAFIACPLVKDTPSVPCWLTRYEGELYYMGVQSDVSAPFTPPFLGHKALVEGTPDPDGTRICGGIVLDPVTVSVMPELSPECDEMIAAEPGYVLPFEPRRPPGPSNGQLAFAGPRTPPPQPQPPFDVQSFDILFDFEGKVDFQTPGDLNDVLRYARAAQAKRILVTGHRAAVRLSDGTVVEEHEGIAKTRAEQVARMFVDAIDSVEQIDIASDETAQPGDFHDRKVTVTVYP